MKKQIITIIMLLILPFVASSNSFAHSGRTDANGGHYNRKTGEYHYHNSGSSSSTSTSDTYIIPSHNNDTYADNNNSSSSTTVSEDKDFLMIL